MKNQVCHGKPSTEVSLLETIEDDKLSLFHVDSEIEATPFEDDSTHFVATLAAKSSNPSVELKGIDVVIPDPTADGKQPDSKDL